jgi:hypothetical protein
MTCPAPTTYHGLSVVECRMGCTTSSLYLRALRLPRIGTITVLACPHHQWATTEIVNLYDTVGTIPFTLATVYTYPSALRSLIHDSYTNNTLAQSALVNRRCCLAHVKRFPRCLAVKNRPLKRPTGTYPDGSEAVTYSLCRYSAVVYANCTWSRGCCRGETIPYVTHDPVGEL